MIEIENLSKEYSIGQKNVQVLKNISLTIPNGEFISIVGQSGSGKSTLMNIIGGLIKPTEGLIKYNYKDITKLTEKELTKYRRDTIGFVFQDFNLEQNETVYENIIMPTIFAGHLDRKKRVNEALDKVGLKHKINDKVSTLSGGEKQRIAIARALINNPQIILADEPTGNLDVKNGIEIINVLKNLSRNGYTVIMVTHNIEHARETDRVVRIKDGEIQSVYSLSEMNENDVNDEIKKNKLIKLQQDIDKFLTSLDDESFNYIFSEKILKKKISKVSEIKEILNIEILKLKEGIR
ncbi:MAG: ABC transporter ATP-binding protein [Clostridiales bacterium]|nr:ABC transporter ATP-binding protein [Clostridiales bacterium]